MYLGGESLRTQSFESFEFHVSITVFNPMNSKLSHKRQSWKGHECQRCPNSEMNDTTSQGLQSVSRIHPDMNTQRTHGLQLLVFQIDTSMNLFTGVPWVIWVISQLWKNWCVQWFGVWRTSSLFWSRIMSKPWDWLIHTRHINRNTRIPGVVRIFTNFHQCRSVWNGRSFCRHVIIIRQRLADWSLCFIPRVMHHGTGLKHSKNLCRCRSKLLVGLTDLHWCLFVYQIVWLTCKQ